MFRLVIPIKSMSTFIPNAFFRWVLEKDNRTIVLIHESTYFIRTHLLYLINYNFVNHIIMSD